MTYIFNKTDIDFKLFVLQALSSSRFSEICFRRKTSRLSLSLEICILYWWICGEGMPSLHHWSTLTSPSPTGLGNSVDPVPVLRTGCFPSQFVRPSTFLSIFPRTRGKPFRYPKKQKNEKKRKERIEAVNDAIKHFSMLILEIKGTYEVRDSLSIIRLFRSFSTLEKSKLPFLSE